MPDAAYAPAPAPVPAEGSKPPVEGPDWSVTKVAAWRRRKDAALEHTKAAIEVGKVNVQRYQGQYLSAMPKTDQAIVPTDFYYIEQKKAQLFYRLPDIFLKPKQPGLDDAAIVFQAAINAKLGPLGVNVLPRIKEVLFDVLCPVGYGAVKIGFEAVVDGTVDVQVGQEPDFEAAMRQGQQPGSVLGLQMPMKPIIEQRPNIVATRYFIERVSPGDLLVPAEFAGSDFDEASFVGMRFREDLPDDDIEGRDSEADDRRLVPLSTAAQGARRKQRTGYEISYKAAQFDSDVKHPDVIRVIKFYDDETDADVKPPALCPYQRYDGMTPAEAEGKIRQVRKVTGMPGFCIAPLTIRYVSDAWLAPSDCSMARNTADELSKGRTQMLTFRDRAMPQFGYDSTRVTKDILAKLERNEMMAGIGFDGPFADAIGPIEKGRFGRENFEFNRVQQTDLDRIWGISANQQAIVNEGSKTATELQLTQRASDDRMGSERDQVLGWYVNKIVPKHAALLQLFAEEEEFVELVGSDAQRLKAIPPQVRQQAQQAGQNASVLVPWNKHLIQGPFAFSAKPDSQLRMDVAQSRAQTMQLWQFAVGEPTTNRQELTRELFKEFGHDPAKFTQPPPPKQAAAASGSVAIKPEDFAGPAAPAAQIIARAIGIDVPDQAVQAMSLFGRLWAEMQAQLPAQPGQSVGPQTEHAGAAPQAEGLSKHAADKTGNMQNTNQRAPIAPGGQL